MSKNVGAKSAKNVSGTTQALLQKVSSQLKGDIISKEAEDKFNVNNYLSSLSKKTQSASIDWDKLQDGELDVEPVSSSGGAFAPPAFTSDASKFLKKKSRVNEKPQIEEREAVPATQTVGRVPALDQASALTVRIGTRRDIMELSDSDLDLDLSVDQEVVDSMHPVKGVSGTEELGRGLAFKKPAPTAEVRPKTSAGFRDVAGKFGPGRNTGSASAQRAIDDDDDSLGLGRGGDKFLKKVPAPAASASVTGSATVDVLKLDFTAPQQKTSVTKGSRNLGTTQPAGNLPLDSDEESLAAYIRDLPVSSSSSDLHRGKRQQKSPRSPKAKAKKKTVSGKVVSSPPIVSERRASIDEISTGESDVEPFRFRVLDLDDLDSVRELSARAGETTKVTSGPKRKIEKENKKEVSNDSPKSHENTEKKSTPKNSIRTKSREKSKGKRKEGADLFATLGLHTVEELFGEREEKGKVEHGAISSGSHQLPSSSAPPLRSILSTTPRSPTPRSSRSRVRLSLAGEDEVGGDSAAETIKTQEDDNESVSPAFSDEALSVPSSGRSSPLRFHRRGSRRSRGLPAGNSEGPAPIEPAEQYYSDDFTSIASTVTESGKKHGKSRRRGSLHDSEVSSYSEAYSSDFLSSRSGTPSPVNLKTRHDKKKSAASTETKQVQTGMDLGDLVYHWDVQSTPLVLPSPAYGLWATNPSPIATHIVSAASLEAMTNYNPAMIALNDMLRQHLQLTSHFAEMQKHLHRSLVSSLEPTYQYTTLDDTKQYIRQHKKPTLTFEEALKQVKAEMELC